MGAKNIIGGTFEDVGEAVVTPIRDEVGKALEQGVQTVVSGPKTALPNKPQAGNSKIETQKNLAEARRKIKWWQDLEEAQKRVREGQKQKQMQATQVVQEEKQIKQFEVVRKQKKDENLIRAQRKTEIKGGVGG